MMRQAMGLVAAVAAWTGVFTAWAETLPATTSAVWSGTLAFSKWTDICACESWDDVAKITVVLDADWGKSSHVLFDYADGACTLSETQTDSFASFDKYGRLCMQAQILVDYIKCVRVRFKIEDGRLLAYGVDARYVSKNNTFPYDFDHLSSSSGGYKIVKLTVTLLDLSKSLVVSGAPEGYGTVTPAYGRSFGYAEGDAISPVLAPASWQSSDGKTSATCTGWKLYSQSAYGGEWAFEREGSTVEPTDLVHLGKAMRLVWQWTPTLVCTAAASDGGSVSPTSASLAYGETFTVTATPVEGYFFAGWTGEGVADEHRCDNPLSVTVSEALSLTAVFLSEGSRVTWTGAGEDALASNPANWEGGACPLPGQGVFVTGSRPMTWDIAYPVGSWTQDLYTATVTVGTVYPDAIADTGPTALVVNGNVDLVTGAWTHKTNALLKTYRLYAKVGGNMTVGENAVVQADGLGYEYCVAVNGKSPTDTCGGSYGGHGYVANGATTRQNYTYGSYAQPEDPGNGGRWKSEYKLPGGGAIRLDVAGALRHDGVIRATGLVRYTANEGNYYPGSGGGIYLVVGTIAGSGKITADSANYGYGGAGGRIAVKLTASGADFSNFDIVRRAEAVSLRGGTGYACGGTHGTIYAETPSDVAGEGWLIMKGNGNDLSGNEMCYGDPFTDEFTSLHFAKLTVTNVAMFRVHSGMTLDLRNTEVVATDAAGRKNGIRLNGGTLLMPSGASAVDEIACRIDCITLPSFPGGTVRIAKNGVLILPSDQTYSFAGDYEPAGGIVYFRHASTLTGNVTVKNGGTFSVSQPLTVNGAVTVEDGGRITQEGPQQAPTYACDITTTGDFTVDAGGKVSVSGKGYSQNYVPGGTLGATGGASHGGRGLNGGNGNSGNAPYGSIVAPATPGAGSSAYAGGGVLKLSVGGTLTVNGSLDSDGVNGTYTSAPGSVNVTAARLAGEGSIHANPVDGNDWYSGSSGGRVAVTLTDPAASFADHWIANIRACGLDCRGYDTSGAGTVLLRTASQDIDHGDLYVRNSGTRTPHETPVGGEVEGTSFRNVTIADNAKLKLVDNATMTVGGSWTNKAAFVAGAGSTVLFAGADDATIAGDNTFVNLSCATAGKTIRVAPGSVQTVTGVLSVSGGTAEGKRVTMCADGEGSWQLGVAGGSAVLSGLDLGGCTSDAALTIINGRDLGGNSDNITFVNVAPGETITWTGAEDASWTKGANWDLNRAPTGTDLVVIPATARQPVLGVDASVSNLALAAEATLSIGAVTLSVGGAASFLGSLSGDAGARLEIGGDATIGGSVSLGGGTIAFTGEGARTLAFATSSQLPTLELDGGTYALSGDVSSDAFTVAAGASLAFAAGEKLTATRFVVSGTSAKTVTLTGEATWKLAAMDSVVDYARVRNSDAGEGLMVVSATSTDLTGNVNWLFEDTRVKWVGGTSGDFSTGANWSDGEVPDESDDVFVTGEATVTLAAAATERIKTLSLGAGARLVVGGTLSTVSSVAVANGATLEWNAHGAIGGNLVMLSGSTLTHAAGGTKRIDLEIAGDGLIQSGAKVDLKGIGYSLGNGPAATWSNIPGTHGGRCYRFNESGPSSVNCYGSIVSPTNCGCAGGNSTYSKASGGGAASLVFSGDLNFAGEIDADGGVNPEFYGAAGGSVRIVARTLIGSGNIHARGSLINSCDASGGGGRVSVVLTGGDFENWTGTMTAYGGYILGTRMGSAGTVYLKAAGKTGRMLIADTMGYTAKYDRTDFPSTSYCDPDETTGIDVEVGNYGTLSLTRDATIGALSISGKSPRILLNGYTLRVTTYTRPRDRAKVEAVVTAGGTAEAPGRIEWPVPPFILIVR